MHRRHIPSLCFFLFVAAMTQPATAESSKAAAATGSGTQPSNLECELKSMRNAAARIRTATLDIISDINQRPLANAASDPLFIEPTAHQEAKDPATWEKEMSELGPLQQPRSSWLDADEMHLKRWLYVLNDNVQHVTVPEGNTAAAAARDQLSAVVQDMFTHMKQLQDLSHGPKFDNLAIGKAALVVHDDVKRLEGPWKALVRATK